MAYANGSQDLMGTIETGKFADMVVIDRDIFHIPENDIKDIQVLNTYMAASRDITATDMRGTNKQRAKT